MAELFPAEVERLASLGTTPSQAASLPYSVLQALYPSELPLSEKAREIMRRFTPEAQEYCVLLANYMAWLGTFPNYKFPPQVEKDGVLTPGNVFEPFSVGVNKAFDGMTEHAVFNSPSDYVVESALAAEVANEILDLVKDGQGYLLNNYVHFNERAIANAIILMDESLFKPKTSMDETFYRRIELMRVVVRHAARRLKNAEVV